jgi:mono/diheme cytochrome c family protein
MRMERQFVSATMVCLIALTGAVRQTAAQQMKTQWDGVYSDAQAARGKAIYSDVCAVCHADNLYGTELAPSLRSAALTLRWGNRPLAQLFEYILSSMPLNSPGGLRRQQNADILAFILQEGKFPAGSGELPGETDALSRIQLTPTKP